MLKSFRINLVKHIIVSTNLSSSRSVSIATTLSIHNSRQKNVKNIRKSYFCESLASRYLSSTSINNLNETTTVKPYTGYDIIIDGQPIHYEKAGNGPHIILLMPGAIGTGQTDFYPQLTGMNPKLFTMIAWDPPGYGKSRPPTKDFNNFYRTDATMASKLMKALNYSRYSVMGWSNGGVCSLILTANEGANCVDKLIVWGTNAYVNEVDRACVSKVRDPTTSWSESFRKTFIDIYGEEELYQLWTRWVDHYISMDDLCKKDLVNIKCPVLLMHGDCDPMMSSDHPLYLTKHISNITLHRFPKGKHNIHQKYVDQFNKLCEDFLTSN